MPNWQTDKLTDRWWWFCRTLCMIGVQKSSSKVWLIHAELMPYLYNFIILRKKNRQRWRWNNSNKTFLNKWESMDFHKLILDICKSGNEISQKHFGPYLKVYNKNCKKFYLKIVVKSQMVEFFEKTKKTLIFALYTEMQILP